MKLLKSLENFFESTLEGTSSSLFRQALKPVEIEARLEQYMLEQAVATHQGKLAPDAYYVTIGSESFQASVGKIGGFEHNCARYLKQVADRNRLVLMNPNITVEFTDDDSLGRRDIRIEAQFTQAPAAHYRAPAPRPEASPNPWPQAPSHDVDTGTQLLTQSHWGLVILDGPQAGKRYRLPEGVAQIGRGGENDIEVTDPGKTVSRRHAILENINSTITIRDVGSSNGTKVNGHSVAYARLSDGDVVSLGNCKLRLQREG